MHEVCTNHLKRLDTAKGLKGYIKNIIKGEMSAKYLLKYAGTVNPWRFLNCHFDLMKNLIGAELASKEHDKAVSESFDPQTKIELFGTHQLHKIHNAKLSTASKEPKQYQLPGSPLRPSRLKNIPSFVFVI